jgi:hypothetical protein
VTTRTPKRLNEKYAAESYLLTVDYSPALLGTDRLDAVDVSIECIEGDDSFSELVLPDESTFNRLTASQRVAAGQAGCTYRITFNAQTLYGETHLVVVDLPVI